MGRHFSKVRGPRAYWAPSNKKVRGPRRPPGPHGSDAYEEMQLEIQRVIAQTRRQCHFHQSCLGRSGIAVACLTAVREVPGSNRAANSCVYRTTTVIYSLGHGLCAPFL